MSCHCQGQLLAGAFPATTALTVAARKAAAADEYTIDWRVGGQAGDIESLLDRFARALLLPETGVRTRWTEWNEKHALRDLAVLLGSGFRVDMGCSAF